MGVWQAFEVLRLAALMDPVDLCPGHGAGGVAIDMPHRGPLDWIGAEEGLARLARIFEFLRGTRQG